MGFLKRFKERYNDENILKTLKDNAEKSAGRLRNNKYRLLRFALLTGYVCGFIGFVLGLIVGVKLH